MYKKIKRGASPFQPFLYLHQSPPFHRIPPAATKKYEDIGLTDLFNQLETSYNRFVSGQMHVPISPSEPTVTTYTIPDIL
jgi:hypothetical protein